MISENLINSQFSRFLSFYKIFRIHKILRNQQNHHSRDTRWLSSPSEALRMPSKGVSESLIGVGPFEPSQSYYKGIIGVCQGGHCEDLLTCL